MQRYSRILPYVSRYWPNLSVILVLTAAACALAVMHPWPLKLLVDYAFETKPVPVILRSTLAAVALEPLPSVLVLTAALASLGLFVLGSAIDTGLTWVWAATGQRMVYDLAADLFRRLQRLSLLFHSRRHVGDLLSRLSGDAYCVYDLTGALLVSPAQHILTLTTVFAVAWHLDPDLALFSVAAAPLLALSALFFGSRLKHLTEQSREVQSQVASFVHQTLVAVPVVQVFGAENRNRRRYEGLASEAVSLAQRSNLLKGTFGLVNGLTMTAGMALILYFGGQRVLSGHLSVGSLLVFVAYMRTMQQASQGLLTAFAAVKNAEARLERVLELLDENDQVRDPAAPVPFPSTRTAEGSHVSMDGVTFGYEPGNPVLHDISLDVHAGETIALVGPTGAGKTTLVSLIPRFFDPSKGQVVIDGVDVRDASLSQVRDRVGIVLQDPFLLPLSVAENIAYGRPAAGRAAIVEAAMAANADEFVRQLPNGYDTVIGERGATLSGGQKQRLAIARAFVKNAQVLILDEPTSALDSASEELLLDALSRLMQGRTTFIISHRLSTIRQTDRVLVLDRSCVVEQGSHPELMALGGLYHRLYSLQFPDSLREVVA